MNVPVYGDAGVVAYTQVDAEDYELAMRFRWNLDDWGYALTHIRKPDGSRTTIKLHQLLMGQPPAVGLTVDHRNRQKLDNRRDNLRWATASTQTSNRDWSNQPRGERHGRAKLNEPDVRALLALKGTMSTYKAADVFNVSPSLVRAVWGGKRWKHLQP